MMAAIAKSHDTLSPIQMLTKGFENAVVVVIGGRGGIGAEVVRQCKELGARVVAGSRSIEQSPDETTTLASGQVRSYALDITNTESIRTFATKIMDCCGRIDVLVNTAGISQQVPLEALDLLTDEFIDEIMTSNMRGPLSVIRELLPLLRKGRDPVIVNLSSIAARTGLGSNIAYAASKAALDTLAISLAKALSPDIRVVNISPTALETDFAKGRGQDFFDATIQQTPLKRIISVHEVAVAVLTAARLLTGTTGTTIYVDGGRHL